jgi:hypothetical protein
MRTFKYLITHGGDNSIEECIKPEDIRHIFRDSQTFEFYHFDDIVQAWTWFKTQSKPYIHSVINKHAPFRFNLELDMEVAKLNNYILSPEDIKKITDAGRDVNFIKYLQCLMRIKAEICNVLDEHYEIESSDFPFHEATDHRDGKYSHRLYLDLAFANMNEYKHFVKLLKERLKESIRPMIDATKLMLRTPESWKDDHKCVWETKSFWTKGVLTYVEDCPVLMEIAPVEPVVETYEIADHTLYKVLSKIMEHPNIKNNFTFNGGVVKTGLIPLKRLRPSFCGCCHRNHDNSDAFAFVRENHIYLGCFRQDSPTHKKYDNLGELEELVVYAGYTGELLPDEPLNWKTMTAKLKQMERDSKTKLSPKDQLKQEIQLKAIVGTIQEEAKKNEANFRKHIKTFKYTDFKLIHGRTFPTDATIMEYIKDVIVKIQQGGNNFYITLNQKIRRDKQKKVSIVKYYTELKQMPLCSKADAISFSIINPDFNPQEAVSKTNTATIKKDLGEMMMDYMKTNFYDSVDFMPYLNENPLLPEDGIFNLFEGYKYKYEDRKYEDEIIDDVAIAKPPEMIQPFISHIINIICRGDRKLARIVIQWFSFLIQKPMEKSFALIIYGKQGCGKSIIYEIMRQLLGEDLTLQFTKMSDLTQTHNDILRGRLLVNCNEATNYPTEKDVNVMKAFIMDTELLINPKNCPLYYVKNWSRTLITTNCSFSMRLTADDRHYMCLDACSSSIGNDNLFKPLIDGQTDETFLNELFLYLANFDISDFKNHRPPMTKYKRTMIEGQADDVITFMTDVINGETNLDVSADYVIANAKEFYTITYVRWCEENHTKILKKGDFTRELKSDKFGLVSKKYRDGDSTVNGYKIVKADIKRICKIE